MFRQFAFALMLLFLVTATNAQQRMVGGHLRDSLTQLPIRGGTLTNAATKQRVQTDSRGFFVLRAAPNDLIYARAPKYKQDTLRYSALFADTITILLAPAAIVLQNVTVESGYAQYQMDSFSRRAEFEEARGYPLTAVDRSRHEGFGLVINLDRFFKKKYRGKRAAERMFNNMEKQAYIDHRFPPQMVAFYTGLKDGELLDFMRQYTPSYEWLRQHPSREEMVGYLSVHLKAYRKSKATGTLK